MAWIRTVPTDDADDSLLKAMADQRALYPPEYQQPVQELDQGLPGIVASHTLIPQALHHAFATFGALMSPELPLKRRQHEMIATMVSLINQCHY
jgi:alkylhydroperoxidase family enzyme